MLLSVKRRDYNASVRAVFYVYKTWSLQVGHVKRLSAIGHAFSEGLLSFNGNTMLVMWGFGNMCSATVTIIQLVSPYWNIDFSGLYMYECSSRKFHIVNYFPPLINWKSREVVSVLHGVVIILTCVSLIVNDFTEWCHGLVVPGFLRAYWNTRKHRPRGKR